MRPPASNFSHSRFQNGVYPPHTTQSRLGKLLKDFYYTPEKLKIHLNIGILGEEGRGNNFFLLCRRLYVYAGYGLLKEIPFAVPNPKK